ncbi:major facilitator superfamily MFS_1 [Cellulomonas fimi ATCC 484]|uniref:Major facilitator superfamily MFS_1 n=1 Tax=Cellulomonas fimi (strain ATCC 484 / DSM 20113 / JCM 1341 / CCUG 24087 / LMG 16345 / NBRC 15513 / NCIMB 8980 / NCTC 7547 / NRS-133) TaxID=590998 RepID=F4H6Y7_CELFA|nr:major facilitator superfamily MFS_1 [Cellulomonas fimi ATCC 484]VEH26477.1 enterobactin exporter EntS [Cellulomonas fimi]
MLDVPNRIVETVVPPRLGTGFRWLLASSWTTNLGDGIVLAAGPLLVASRTDDAFLVALAALLQWLPPLLFGLWAGALTDRLDRRRLVVTVNALRVVVLVLLASAVLLDAAPIALVLAAMFLLGTAETFADNASSTLVPMLVQRDDLVVANSRIQAGFVTVNQLAGPPIGAALFALGQSVPFFAEALLVAAGAVMVSRLDLPPVHTEREPTHIRHDIAEGVRWVLHHAAVRTLVLTILIFNVTFGAAWSVLVLYAQQRLGLGAVGFGLVTTVQAAGGLLATFGYGWLTARVSLANLMRIGLVLETLTHLALALTTTAWFAMVVFFVFGAHAFVWGTTSVTIRQRAVPTALQGRVGSVNLVGVFGGLVIGAGIGGLLAQHYGVTAPFWFAFVGSAVFVVLIWRQLRHVAHADEQDAPEPL